MTSTTSPSRPRHSAHDAVDRHGAEQAHIDVSGGGAERVSAEVWGCPPHTGRGAVGSADRAEAFAFRGIEEPFIEADEVERWSLLRSDRECCPELRGIRNPEQMACEYRQRAPADREHIRHLVPDLGELSEAAERIAALLPGELALSGSTLDSAGELHGGPRPRDDVGVLFQQ